MKYALITGGSRGIGRAVCVKLARMGYHILINYASNTAEAEKTLELVRQAGQDGEILMFDVSDRVQTHEALEAWEKAHPEEYIEVLVNNAGIRRDNVMAFMPPEDWNRVLDITLSGFYNVTQPLLQPMLAHKFGRIINMASVSGLKGIAGQTNYSTAKGGIIAATKALAQEVARKNVTVNAVAPGFIKTDMVEGLDEGTLKKTIPANRFGTPEEVAEAVGFLASPGAGYITGNVISINGGLYT
ncbi:MAG: 3-oxoacyl-ACP reductase FabG [Bacteroides sp.]|nr:3-oxoacyl-ACP reductase FabG [Bacteroides sp.]